MTAPASAQGSKVKASPRGVASAVFERLMIVLLIAGSVFLAWWSIGRLDRAQKESVQVGQRMSRLETDVDVMRGTWSAERLQGVSNRVGQAYDLLFVGKPAIVAWREDLIRQVVPLALDPRVTFLGTRTQVVGDRVLTLVQAAVEVTPAVGVPVTRSAYERVLDLSHRLANHPRRVDFVKLTVEGSSNSVSRASAVLDLWATEEELANK